MLGMPKILLSGDSPSAPMNHEEDDSNHTHDHEVTQQLGEAMEDNVTIELQASYEGGEGCVENTTNPPKEACVDEKRGPFRENTLKDTLEEGRGPFRENTLKDTLEYMELYDGEERSFQGEYSEGYSGTQEMNHWKFYSCNRCLIQEKFKKL